MYQAYSLLALSVDLNPLFSPLETPQMIMFALPITTVFGF